MLYTGAASSDKGEKRRLDLGWVHWRVLHRMLLVEELECKLKMALSVFSTEETAQAGFTLRWRALRKKMNSSRRYNITASYIIYINYYQMINDVNIASKTSKLKSKHDEDLIHTNQILAFWQQCKLAFAT